MSKTSHLKISIISIKKLELIVASLQCRSITVLLILVIFKWRCRSFLPKNYKFGKLLVNCEGFDNDEDEYVVVDSCWVNSWFHLK